MTPRDSLQITIAAYLAKALTSESWFCAIPNETRGRGKRAMWWTVKQRRKGLRKGAPDFLVIHKGMALFMEVKSANDRVKPEQALCHQDIAVAGGTICVVRPLDEVWRQLSCFGVPLNMKPI